MSKVDLRIYHDSLADILCWIDGYQAANQSGVGFQRLNIDGLRELKSDLYGALYGKSPAWINTTQSDIEEPDILGNTPELTKEHEKRVQEIINRKPEQKDD